MKWSAILIAVLPVVVEHVGEGVREALAARREADKPCKHGRPGGRLCAKCTKKKKGA
jgi:hypothetical protein